MTTLFTIHSSWHESVWLFEQCGFACAGDSILLMQDSVLALHSPITLASFIAKCSASNAEVFALRDDVRLRGVQPKYDAVNLIGYDGFVDLVAKHDKQVAW